MRLPFILVGQFETTPNGTKLRRWFRNHAYELQDDEATKKVKAAINISKLVVFGQALSTGSFLFALGLIHMLGEDIGLSFWNIILISILNLPITIAYRAYKERQLNRLLETAPRHSEAVSR